MALCTTTFSCAPAVQAEALERRTESIGQRNPATAYLRSFIRVLVFAGHAVLTCHSYALFGYSHNCASDLEVFTKSVPRNEIQTSHDS